MGILNPIIDPTGQLTQEEVNSQNLSQVIDEMNRNSDQLDAIANSMNIINKGSRTIVMGASSTSTSTQVAHGFGSAPIFLSFFNRSDQSTLWYAFPDVFTDGSGSVILAADSSTDAKNINFSFVRSATGSAITFIVSYYILQQPAQVPTGA